MSAHGWRTFHMLMVAVWSVLVIPAWLWWRDSVFFVIFVSLYANAATHFSAWQAARAEEAQEG